MKPTLSIESATQLAVFLANRPGALARVCDALAEAKINIHALATSDTVDHTVTNGKDGKPDANAAFDKSLPAGQSVDITFSNAGTFNVTCKIHSSMNMTVTVQ